MMEVPEVPEIAPARNKLGVIASTIGPTLGVIVTFCWWSKVHIW